MKVKAHSLGSMAVIVLLCWTACQPAKESTVASAMQWDKLATHVVDRAQPAQGEKVVFVARPGSFDPLIPLLAEKFQKAGAIYLGTISVDSLQWPKEWLTDSLQERRKGNATMAAVLTGVDLGVMLPGTTPADEAYGTMQSNLRAGKGRTIHFHWSGAFDLSSQPLAMTPAADSLYQRAILDADYGAIATAQSAFEQALRKDWVTVTTPRGTNLRFRIGDRPVTRQDGDGSAARASQGRNLIDREVELPAGAVRVAPEETSVEGTIAYPDMMVGQQSVKNLKLGFKAGKIVDVQASEGLDSIKSFIYKQYNNKLVFRELAVGFNPLLSVESTPTWIPHYGYGSGVVRLSLGDNRELGGIVEGVNVWITFFTDATVTADGKNWAQR